MDGNEYYRIIAARRYDLNNRVTRATAARARYTQAAAAFASSHGERPSGLLSIFSGSRYAWQTFESEQALNMGDDFEQLRIATNRGIEGIAMASSVTTVVPAQTRTVLVELGRLVDLGRAQVNWYLNAPVSRFDTNRSLIERYTRVWMTTYPNAASAMRSANISEGQAARAVVQSTGGAIPEMPDQALERQGPKSEERADARVAGIVGDPEGDYAQAGAAARRFGEDLPAAAGSVIRSGAEFGSRVANTAARLTGNSPAAGGSGISFTDGLAIAGVGALAIGGVYLFIKTRPSVVVAGRAMRSLQGARANPEECE